MFWVCVSVALVIQHAKLMRRIILSFVAYLGLLYIFHFISQKARISEREIRWLNIEVRVDFLHNSVGNFSHSKKNWVRYYHKF
jgi:hypothetical protein